MPKIELKPNSPEYNDSNQCHADERRCDIAHCSEPGVYKAPKSRGLNEYYHFCLDHVRDYNKSWNFFDGMAAREVEEHMLRSLYGDRPTWRNDMGPDLEDQLHSKVWQTYHHSEVDPQRGHTHDGMFNAFHHGTPEYEAMAVLGVEPPLDIDLIKKRYKELAKKHHPDFNPDCEKSEELLKEVNIAYTVLKEAFEKYEKLQK